MFLFLHQVSCVLSWSSAWRISVNIFSSVGLLMQNYIFFWKSLFLLHCWNLFSGDVKLHVNLFLLSVLWRYPLSSDSCSFWWGYIFIFVLLCIMCSFSFFKISCPKYCFLVLVFSSWIQWVCWYVCVDFVTLGVVWAL